MVKSDGHNHALYATHRHLFKLVIPAQAGIQSTKFPQRGDSAKCILVKPLDSRLRGNDGG